MVQALLPYPTDSPARKAEKVFEKGSHCRALEDEKEGSGLNSILPFLYTLFVEPLLKLV